MGLTVKLFKEGGEGVRPIGPKQEYVVAKPQPKDGFIEFRIKGILIKVAHEQVSIVGGNTGAHGHVFEVMTRVEGEVVLGEDKLGKFDKELSGWYGIGWTFIKEMFQSREAMGVRDVGV